MQYWSTPELLVDKLCCLYEWHPFCTQYPMPPNRQCFTSDWIWLVHFVYLVFCLGTRHKVLSTRCQVQGTKYNVQLYIRTYCTYCTHCTCILHILYVPTVPTVLKCVHTYTCTYVRYCVRTVMCVKHRRHKYAMHRKTHVISCAIATIAY